jgi:hypothetical protein
MKKVIYFLSLSILTLTASCGGGQAETPKDEWYAGGTLHKSSLQTWNSSTEKNKLATCADFVANVKDYEGDFTQMKADATEVMNCIEEPAKEPDLSSQKANEVAASCIILLGIAQ